MKSETKPLLFKQNKSSFVLVASESNNSTRRFGRWRLVLAVGCSFFVLHWIHRNFQGDENLVQRIRRYITKQKFKRLFNDPKSPKNLPLGCVSSILILPHCEADTITHVLSKQLENSCNYLGMERSYYLMTQFGPNRRWPIPLDILTLEDSFRTQITSRASDTARPTQQYFNIQNRQNVTASYADVTSMVHETSIRILNGELCDQVIVIIPNDNSDIARIGYSFGCSDCPPFWGGNYDEGWELRMVYSNNTDVTNMNHQGSISTSGASLKLNYASVKERFDALHFSKLVGDYRPPGHNHNQNDASIPTWANWSIYEILPSS